MDFWRAWITEVILPSCALLICLMLVCALFFF